jgi:hypothetical protein
MEDAKVELKPEVEVEEDKVALGKNELELPRLELVAVPYSHKTQ